MDSVTLYEQLIQQLDVAVFKYICDGQYTPVGVLPEWYSNWQIHFDDLERFKSVKKSHRNRSDSGLRWQKVKETVQCSGTSSSGAIMYRLADIENSWIQLEGNLYLLFRLNPMKHIEFNTNSKTDFPRGVDEINASFAILNMARFLKNPVAGVKDSLKLIKSELDHNPELGAVVQSGLNQTDKIVSIVQNALNQVKNHTPENAQSTAYGNLGEVLDRLKERFVLTVTGSSSDYIVLVPVEELEHIFILLMYLLCNQNGASKEFVINVSYGEGFVTSIIYLHEPGGKETVGTDVVVSSGTSADRRVVEEYCLSAIQAKGGYLSWFEGEFTSGYQITMPVRMR